MEAVFSEVDRFADAREHEDDLTIVVMKRLRDARSGDTRAIGPASDRTA